MNIAFFLPTISYPLGKSILAGVRAAAQQSGDRILCLMGSPIIKNRPYPMYKLALKDDIDGLIVYGGGMGQFVSENELREFLNLFSHKPLLNIGYKVSGFNNIGVDNYKGFKEMILHLIVNHGHRKIAYVNGPSLHPESIERLQAYKDALNSCGIQFDEELIIPGDFTAFSGRMAAAPLLRLLKEKKISAVAFACDTMASAGIAELRKRGLSFPHDLALVGFDNSDEAISRLPGLSTVDQKTYDLGRESLLRIREIIKNPLRDSDLTLSVETVFRESCGCLPDMIRNITAKGQRDEHLMMPFPPDLLDKLDDKTRNEMLELLDSDIKSKTESALLEYIINSRTVMDLLNTMAAPGLPLRHYQDHLSMIRKQFLDKTVPEYREGMEKVLHQMRVFIQLQTVYSLTSKRIRGDSLMQSLNNVSNQFISISSFEEIRVLLDEEMSSYKAEACGISLLNRDVQTEYSLEYLYSRKKAPIQLPFVYHNTNFLPRELDLMWKEGTFLMRPLFSQNQYWGFIFYIIKGKLSVNDGIYIESLSSQIASAIMQIRLVEERNRAEENLRMAYQGLEQVNLKLENLSYKDELTGMYNRRGFMELSENLIKDCRENNQDFLILFGDLDGLKLINDVYGHKEGDFAIKSIAGIIRSVCRDSDIIARLGGDEFVSLIPRIPSQYKSILKERIINAEKKMNENSNREFKISCSFGMILGSECPHTSLTGLMTEADKRLYEEKRLKKN